MKNDRPDSTITPTDWVLGECKILAFKTHEWWINGGAPSPLAREPLFRSFLRRIMQPENTRPIKRRVFAPYNTVHSQNERDERRIVVSNTFPFQHNLGQYFVAMFLHGIIREIRKVEGRTIVSCSTIKNGSWVIVNGTISGISEVVEMEYVCCLCGLSYQGSWLHGGPAEHLYLC
jgi:hypothetical protein